MPQSSVGAPLPVVLADEGNVLLAYLLEVRDPDWDGTSIRVVTPSSDEPAVLVRAALRRACAGWLGAIAASG
jgi:hypothetical protein